MSARRLLAGDVGGTKVLMQLVEVHESHRKVAHEERFESSSHRTFDEIVARFLARAGAKPVDAACFAVAGPVLGDRATVTNLAWNIDAPALASAFSIRHVALINDFYAVALGVPLLESTDLLALQAGRRVEHAPIAILGAGTGLGQANLVHDGRQWVVVPSEGGHADFAPQDVEQCRLLDALHAKYGPHVSWERLLSGMGLVNIHNFVTGKEQPYDETLPAVIADAAKKADPAAKRTFEIFADIYGAEAGNMALRVLARGGVFLAGGIAGKNIEHFTDGRFIAAFRRKGRFSSLLAEIPVDVIINPAVGLLGAAEMASRLVPASLQC